MILTEQQKEQVKQFLHARVGNTQCPQCQNSHLDFEPRLTALVTLHEENRQNPTEFMHLLPLICHYCGYTRLFSAKHIGLIK